MNVVTDFALLSSLCIHAALCCGGESQHDSVLQAVDEAWRPHFSAVLSGREAQTLSHMNQLLSIAAGPKSTKSQIYLALLESHLWQINHGYDGLAKVSSVRKRWAEVGVGRSYEVDKGWLLAPADGLGDLANVPRALRVMNDTNRDVQASMRATANLLGFGGKETIPLVNSELIDLRNQFPRVAGLRLNLAMSPPAKGNAFPEAKKENFQLARYECMAYLKLEQVPERQKNKATIQKWIRAYEDQISKL